ncbi:Hypothetical predicted protein [Mytilus galloprovincialis]|uniref:Uncharacterized protein n=1 Tax=Mytilus galloprovincialis TaxID=29158 RepID=A0A8B6H055_MYTGA|nr:Hypothetical predicted protein [Mytilus galloprovincialis]
MADKFDSAIVIFNKDSKSKTSHEFDELDDNHEDINHETESLLEQKKERTDLPIPNQPLDDGIIEELNDSKYSQENGQSVFSDDTAANEKNTSVKSRVKIINGQSTTTPKPATPNKKPSPANPVDSNNRPSDEHDEKVRTSMSEQWKLMSPRLKCCICIMIISNVVVGLVGATAFIMFFTKECDKKPDAYVCNGNNYTCSQNDGIFNYYTGLQNDPFFQTAFPKKESAVNLICFLPFKGKYTLVTDFENGSKGSNVSKICSEANKTHQYKLYCNKDHVTECEIQKCSEECSKFNISLSEMHVIVIQLDTGCLSLNGKIAIWNSTIK